MQKIKALPISLPATRRQTIFLSLTFLSFAVPFVLGNSQFSTGILVNTALFASAILLPTEFFLPVVIFPSLAVLSRGLIFGPFTYLLIYMLPFIWAGNFLLIGTFKKIYSQLSSYLSAIVIASFAKFLFLLMTTNLMFRLGFVPQLFLTTMGIYQLLTALSGGMLAYIALKKACHGKI